MIASELTKKDVNRTLVLGKNSKKRRGNILEIQSNASMVRVHLNSNGKKWITLSPSEEIELEF
ncbi:hypothetical protein CJ179_38665 [Rhodococcus sp. ACS1]|uniref:hypothetical protein n=1 Tax=Rhodococcus sp. ACS1 TaxID=2028570 RepID=UPI000BB0E08A|nr:hypothetical protein [Rhodococcus sp. ACS1]PBC38524.1 hypothetical protein CJ179_38665 [Rhodococcus sp. ACS1]